MTTSSDNLFKFIIYSWLELALFIVFSSLFTLILLTPTIILTRYVNIGISDYILICFIGWVILFATSLLKHNRGNEISELLNPSTESAENTIALTINAIPTGILSAIYLNGIILTGAVIAYFATGLSYPFFGLVVAILYPMADFELAQRRFSPGEVILYATIYILHLIGVDQDLSADEIIRGMTPAVLTDEN